jgi:flagellar hook-associated protein 2
MAITSAGVGSGLDLEAIIRATVDAENIPKLAQLDKRESALNLQITALGQMKSNLSTFNTQLEKLADINNFNMRTANVTQPTTGGDLVSVTSESTATTGSFKISDVVMAKGSRIQSKAGSEFTSTTDVVTTAGGDMTFTAGASSFSITLAAGATLADLRTAINDASDNFGVSANIINTGTTTNLVLTSSKTGTGNDLVITNTHEELNKVSTVQTGATIPVGMETNISASSASMKIDGIDVTSETNTFTNAIQDSTITVLRDSDPLDLTNDYAKLDVETDKDTVKATIEEFISSYNTLMDTLNTVATSKTADATARGLRRSIIDQMGTFVSGAGNLQSVYDIGFEMDKDNMLSLNATAVNTLDDALTNSYDDVGTLFAGTGGVATVLEATVDLYLNSSGVIKNQQDALDQAKKDVTQDRDNHAYRMDLFEKRLREKYASLDVLIAGMRSQGSAVTSALANLPGFGNSKK